MTGHLVPRLGRERPDPNTAHGKAFGVGRELISGLDVEVGALASPVAV
jgi:hypothetical protein